MNFNEYQALAETFAEFQNEYYPIGLLMIDTANLAHLFNSPESSKAGIAAEYDKSDLINYAGNVLWDIAVLLKRNNIKLEAIAQYNIDKLQNEKRNHQKLETA